MALSVDTSRGICPSCKTRNRYTNTECSQCQQRLPWAPAPEPEPVKADALQGATAGSKGSYWGSVLGQQTKGVEFAGYCHHCESPYVERDENCPRCRKSLSGKKQGLLAFQIGPTLPAPVRFAGLLCLLSLIGICAFALSGPPLSSQRSVGRKVSSPIFDVPALIGKNAREVVAALGDNFIEGTQPDAAADTALGDSVAIWTRREFMLVMNYRASDYVVTSFVVTTNPQKPALLTEEGWRGVAGLDRTGRSYTVEFIDIGTPPNLSRGVMVKAVQAGYIG